MSTTATTATARFRYLGTSDDVTTCEKCGKDHLRATVVIQPMDVDGNDDGEVSYYGSTCGARALGVSGGGRSFLSAATGARLQTLMAAHDAVRMLRYYGLPAAGDVDHDTLRRAVRIYVRSNSGVAERVSRTGMKVPDMVLDMLARKRAAIGEAVIVAGAGWVDDAQPLDWGYRSEIKRCQTQEVAA